VTVAVVIAAVVAATLKKDRLESDCICIMTS